MEKSLIITNEEFKGSLNFLMEVNDVESDIADLTNRLDDIQDSLKDDVGRVGYIRQLTAEFLELFSVLGSELEGQVKIPKTMEKLNKVLNRPQRKRYYMSKFRL